MSEMWKRWEGRVVDGKFPLQSYLGGSDHSAVFLTHRPGSAVEPEKAAIKLILRDDATAEKKLAGWRAARDLIHPNLIRTYQAGPCKLDDTKLLYVVEEYAEENLSQILPERALTAEEARGMLPPILDALQYVQGNGLVHGHIKPSNILAIGDQVKLSSDTLAAAGDRNSTAPLASGYDPPEADTGTISTAGDCWRLGMTLIEVLTQRLPVWDRARKRDPEVPATVPEPFHEIAAHCLQVDPRNRWTIAQVGDRLEGKQPRAVVKPASPREAVPVAIVGGESQGRRKVSKKWSYLLGFAVVLAVAFAVIPRRKPLEPPAAVQTTPVESGSTSEDSRSAQSPTAPQATPRPDAGVDSSADTPSADNPSGVVRRVVPEVSPGARRTIHGTIQIRVKVKVDAAGNVVKAKLESGRASRYFKRLAMDAARDWKFSPVQGEESRDWRLQFGFSRAKTEASAQPIKR